MSNRVSPHGAPLSAPLCVSNGTLRTPDLLRAFADELERLKPFSSRQLITDAREYAQHYNDVELESIAEETIEAAHTTLQSLDQELQSIAEVHGLIFDQREGDGACFGFWLPEPEETE